MEMVDLFYTIKGVHEPLVGLSFLFIIISDLYALTWYFGYKEKLNLRALKVLHALVGFFLFGLILTGVALVYIDNSFLVKITFWIKMMFVVVLFWNSFRIGKEIAIPSVQSYKELDNKTKKHFFVVGATSLICWIGAFIVGGML